MIKAVLLDMDDTLIVNQALFERAEAQLYGYLQNFGVRVEEARHVFNETDKALFETYGRSPKRPPETYEAVLRNFVPDADEEMVSIVREQGVSMFKAVADIKPGVPEAIDIMAEHYPLYIVTAGGEDVQRSRMEHLPFMDKISGVLIVPGKNVETYKAAVKKWNLNPDETVMVGNSLDTDVLPAVDAGLQAVWIDAHISARHETVKSLPEKEGAYQFPSLLDMAQTLVENGKLAASSAPPQNSPIRKSAAYNSRVIS